MRIRLASSAQKVRMRSIVQLYASLLSIGLALYFAPIAASADQTAPGNCDSVSQDVIIIILPPTYTEGDYTYSVTNGMATIVKFNNTAYAGALTITNSLGGYPVVEIYQNAFAQCNNLTDVTIPEGVTNIWLFAFSMCDNLRSASLPATLNAFSAGTPFFMCNKLEAISVNPDNPFYWSDSYGVLYCREPSTIYCHPPAATNEYYTIPDGITNIETRAFFGSRYLSGVSIPASVRYIGAEAFSSCVGLKDVSIPAGVTRIEEATFNYCIGLTNIVLSPCTEYIGTAAFQCCFSLSNITIPYKATNIADFAFDSCTSLQGVFVIGNPPVLEGDYVFYTVTPTIYYLPAYTSNWPAIYGGCPTQCWNPTVQNSVAFGFETGGFGFNIAGTANIPLVIQATTNLSAGVWSSLTNTTLGASGSLYFSDPSSSNYPSRFYRIVWP